MENIKNKDEEDINLKNNNIDTFQSVDIQNNDMTNYELQNIYNSSYIDDIYENSNNINNNLIRSDLDEKDKLEMKKILERFYNSAENVVSNLVKESKNNEYIKEIITTKQDSLLLDDNYEIKVRFSNSLGEKKKFYDIYEVKSGKCLTKDLFLFEAAEAIVKLLNRGENIFSEKIRKVIFYEQKYTKNRQDSIILKKRLNESANKKLLNKNILKTKYEKAILESKKAKNKILEIINEL